MDDWALTQAVTELGSEFLNGEAAPEYAPDADGTDVDAFVEAEARRFKRALWEYVNDRIQNGEYVGAEHEDDEDNG